MAGIIGFTLPEYKIKEDGTWLTAQIAVQRTGSSEGAVSVTVKNSSSTAPARASRYRDYQSYTQILSWAEGELGAKLVDVEVFQDAFIEGDEAIFFSLTGITGATYETGKNKVSVIIVDDDNAIPVHEWQNTSLRFKQPDGSWGISTNLKGDKGDRGINWRNIWSATTAYSIGDGISYNGSSYVAIANNTNSPPSPVNPNWGMLASIGSQGIQGATGPQGATGATGAIGPQGIQGATGATGAVGPQGAIGPQGATGARGLNWKGTWSSATAYVVGDGIAHNGSSYIAIANNTNSTPSPVSSNWGLLASIGSQGIQGAVGPQGETGAVGPQGATGATGATGAVGPKGLNWRGAWSAATAYAINDAVSQAGSSYIAIAANTNSAPPSANWQILSSVGATGATGATGAQGPQGLTGATGATGAQGPQGLTGATGATGPQGIQGLTGATGAVGPQGATGATGPQGAKGLNWRGTWNATTAYSVDDAVVRNGTSYIAIAANTNSAPPSANWQILATVPGDTNGTWTPAISPGNHQYSSRSGTWYRIGRLTFINFAISVSAKDLAALGTLKIQGFPNALTTLFSAIASGYGLGLPDNSIPTLENDLGLKLGWYNGDSHGEEVSIEDVDPIFFLTGSAIFFS